MSLVHRSHACMCRLVGRGAVKANLCRFPQATLEWPLNANTQKSIWFKDFWLCPTAWINSRVPELRLQVYASSEKKKKEEKEKDNNTITSSHIRPNCWLVSFSIRASRHSEHLEMSCTYHHRVYEVVSTHTINQGLYSGPHYLWMLCSSWSGLIFSIQFCYWCQHLWFILWSKFYNWTVIPADFECSGWWKLS